MPISRNSICSPKFFLLFLIISGTLVGKAVSQGFSNHHWYFGDTGAAIDFNKSDGQAGLVGNQATPYGRNRSAVATDPFTGELLFYTDGNRVYDADHAPMPGGPIPGGEKPVAICEVPGQSGQYYIITNDATLSTPGTISYSVVDMNLPGNAGAGIPPKGQVISTLTATGLTNTSEAMLVLPKENSTGFWLIYKLSGGNNTYAVSDINASTFQAPVTFNLGDPLIAGSLKYHAATGKIAVVPQDAGRNVQILNFDAISGTLTFDTDVQFSGGTPSVAVFDAEWSASGSKLYLSRQNPSSDLLQYDVASPGSALVSILPTPITRSFGLKLGPDNAIYHLYETSGNILMGRIGSPDSLPTLVDYATATFLSTPFEGTRLPHTAAFNPEITVDFSPKTACTNLPTQFIPEITNNVTGKPVSPDSLRWDFGDTTTSNSIVPIHTFNGTPPNPMVQLTAFLGGTPYTFSAPVTLSPYDLEVELVNDTTICADDFPFSITAQGTSGATSLTWSNGQTGPTLTLNTAEEAGFYYLTAEQNSCTGYYPITVRIYRSEEQRANVWYFGSQAGIDFNGLPSNPAIGIPQPPPAPAPGDIPLVNNMVAPEGTSVISDANGNPVFYTDGNKVWDKQGNEITSGIGGENASAQSALIVPVPGHETLYYIFTTQEVGSGSFDFELNYSIFDLAQNGGLGAVVESDHVLFAPSTERIASDGNWLIAHELGTNTFRSYPITANGIGDPVLSSTGSVHSKYSTTDGQGYLKLSSNGQLAVALNNTVELFNFSSISGRVTNPVILDFPQAGQAYGVEFSNNGRNLYASLLDGANGKIFLWEVDTTTSINTLTDPQYIRDSRVELPLTGQFGALQNGPDGTLYVAEEGAGSLVTITNPNQDPRPDPNDLSIIQLPNTSTISLAGQTSGLGLPNFIQTITDPLQDPSFRVRDACDGEVVSFEAEGSSSFDKYSWTVRDAGGTIVLTSQEQNFEHTFSAPGSYTVSLLVTNDCIDPATNSNYTFNLDPVTITIFPLPASPVLPPSTVLCDNTPLLLNANNGEANIRYIWESNGQVINDDVNDPDIEPSEPGTYNYSLTSEKGCITQGSVEVVPAASFTLNNPGPLCRDDLLTLSPSPIIAGSYQWAVSSDGGTTFTNLSNAQDQNVDTSIPGDYIYQLTINPDASPNCLVTEAVPITVSESADFTLTGGNASGACNATNGTIDINITSTGSYSYSVQLRGVEVASGANATGPSASPIGVTGLEGGTYQVILTNEVTNCTQTEVVTVTNSFTSFSATVTSVTPLDCEQVRLTVEVSPVTVYPVNYVLLNTTTGQRVASANGVTNNTPTSFNITGNFPTGNYVLEVVGNTGCTDSASTSINLNNPELTAIGPTTVTVCSPAPAELQVSTPNAADVARINWIGPSGFSQNGTDKVSVTSAGTYTASLSNGTCNQEVAFTVAVNSAFTVSFDIPKGCGDLTLEAKTSISGNYTYEWFKNGISHGFGERIPVTESDTYRVEATDVTSGCRPPTTSDSKRVDVVPEFDVDILFDPPCSGGPFEVRADAKGADVFFKWKVNGTIDNSTTGSPLTIDAEGENSFSVEVTAVSNIQNSCEASDKATIIRKEGKGNPFDLSYAICPEDPSPDFSELKLPASEEDLIELRRNFLNVVWKNRSGGPDPTVEPDGFTVIISAPGEYEAALTDINNCTAFYRVKVAENCEPRITAPNAFAPDGTNRTFRVFPIFVTDFEIFIFSRWGEIVYHSNDKNFRWDGSFNGRALPTGTYAYIISYANEFRPSQKLEQRGGVLLIR